jgi:uncharacterized membrane protein YhhN
MTTGSAVCLGVAGLAALGNWWSRLRDDHRLESVTKPAVTLALIGAALTLDAHPAGARPWFIAALALCVVGDIALLKAVDQFVVGLGAFLVGHVLFAVGALVMGVHAAWLPVPLAAVAVGTVVAPVLRPIVRGAGPLAGPVVAYFGVISVASCLLVATGRAWAIAGAVAFMVSDSILGTDKFVRRLPWSPVAVMVTYHVALTALVLSLR